MILKGKSGTISAAKEMATILEPVTVAKAQWECKQCHQMIPADETVAYHLINKVLYGWCEPCFSRRSELPAAD
jgi:hypothetical protein